MGSLEETLNKANAEKSLQEINQSIIGTGETILDLNKTLTRLEDSLRVIGQNIR